MNITPATLEIVKIAAARAGALRESLQLANESTRSGLLGLQLIALIKQASDLEARVNQLHSTAVHEAGTP